MINIQKELMNIVEMLVTIEIVKDLTEEVRKEMGLDEENWIHYLNQIEMDNKGFGFNGKANWRNED